mgnify:CR=1 FL=1
MTEWVASKCVKRHCMNFPTALASLPFSLYNRSLLYAWNLYSSNSSIWYFLSKAVTLASIFSSFIAHNGLCSRLTYKWQDLPLNSRQGEVPIDRSLAGSSKEPKGLNRAWLTNPWEIDRSFSQESAWSQDSSFFPDRLNVVGMWWSIDELSQIVGKLVRKHSEG